VICIREDSCEREMYKLKTFKSFKEISQERKNNFLNAFFGQSGKIYFI